MKKTISALLTATMLMVSAPLLADAQSDIEARAAGLKVAMDERDDKAIKKFLTKDFQSVDISGETSDADDMITRLAMIPVDPAMKSDSKIVSVTVEGPSAKVVQTRGMKMQREGRDGVMHQGEFITSSNDTWVQQGTTWLLKSTEVQEVTMKRDGVVMRSFKKGDPIPPRRPRGEGRGEGRGPAGEGSPPPPAN
jgi:hypothetical protein